MTSGDTRAQRTSSLCSEVLLLDSRLAVTVGWSNTSSKEGGGGGGKLAHSPAPWNAAAGLCRMDLHALVREVERTWRTEAGIPLRGRGGSDANTRESLAMLAQICDAISEVTFTQGLRELTRWLRAAKMIMGDLERPRRLACVNCGGKTLLMHATTGTVQCVNPRCRMRGSLEFAEGEVRIAWDASDTAAG